MKLALSQENRDFIEEVRAFVDEALTPEIRKRSRAGRTLDKDTQIRWQKLLHERGWIAPNWPKEYGGTGWSPIKRYLFDREIAAAGAPRVIPFGIDMVGPVIIAFGSEEQKRRYLPRILSSDDWWCQGFSEPGAGSDLASLKTRAVRDGDHYVINGSKIWTTLAQHADMMFCLARTSIEDRKQRGISFILIDMQTPGITVSPIQLIDGGFEVNQVFFEDVRVPVENLVGEEGRGWDYAKFLLGHERTGIAGIGRSLHQFSRLKAMMEEEVDDDGRPLIDNPRFADRLARLEIELKALDATVLRMLSREEAGGAPGPESSILKIKGTEIQQTITELMLDAVGPYGAPYLPEADEPGWNGEPVGPAYAVDAAPYYFNWRKVTIYGGSNEIQKNIIAKAILGL